MMDAEITEFEPLDCASPLAGPDVIEDICRCVAQALQGRAGLLPTDAYGTYSAKAVTTLQLQDVDRVDLRQDVEIGTVDPGKCTQVIEVTVPDVGAVEVRERCEVAEPTFEKEGSALPAKPRRWYTPRQPRNKGARK
jgi:hypothetical protein